MNEIDPGIVVFTLGGKQYKYNVPTELKVDKANIDDELRDQASTYGFIYILSESLNTQLKKFNVKKDIVMEDYKDKIKILEADIFLKAKEQGFSDGKAKEVVKANGKRRELFELYLKEREELELKSLDMELTYKKMHGYVKGLEQRAMSLTTLGGMAKREMSMGDSV